MTVFDEIRKVLEKHKENIPVVAMTELLAVIDGAERKKGKDWEKFIKAMRKAYPTCKGNYVEVEYYIKDVLALFAEQ